MEGYEISLQCAQRSAEMARKVGLRSYKIMLNVSGDPTQMPQGRDPYDVAVVSEVLMHQRPKNIVPVMVGLAEVARKVAVISYYDPGDVPYQEYGTDDPEGGYKHHCFHYDYRRICAECGLEIGEWQTFKEQVLFTYAKQ